MKLTFHGGAGIVTGANYLLETEKSKILVDCGLIQGCNFCEKQNWEPFLYSPQEIKAVFITHSHIDHIGRLPKLYKDGFRGKIYSTEPAREAGELALLDSDHILAQEAERLGKPILYSEEDIKGLMKLWRGRDYGEEIRILGDLEIRFYNAGHILGSASILVDDGETKIVFSGDLGNSPAPLLGDKDPLPAADYCLIESTYGDRLHENVAGRRDILEDLIEETVKASGVLMIPAFAMERTQELLKELNDLIEGGRIPPLPIFLDSPLAIKLTAVYKKYRKYLSAPADFNFPGLKLTLTTEESKAINDVPPPKVIIAGSGMSHGGRILHHEKRYLPDPKNTLFIIGYQAGGSLGRQLLDGAKKVKIHGEAVAVNCRVKNIAGYSAHADQAQLLEWLKPQRQRLKKVFVVQGEEAASNTLAQKIKDELAVAAETPKAGRAVVL